jgi:N4-gp56 family major capsid protein
MEPTKLADLFVPEVIAQEVEQKLIDKLVMEQFMEVDTTLQGRAGDTVTLPSFQYIGDAQDVAEGEAIPTSKLAHQTRQATIKKIGKGVPVTDEAVLSGYGDPIGEATSQLAVSIKSKLDADTQAMLDTDVKAGMTVGDGSAELDDALISKALVKFGEDIEGQMVCPINPDQLASLRDNNFFIPASEIGADIKVNGSLGMIHGVQFVIRNRVKANGGKINNYIIKERPIKYLLKRDVLVETARDAGTQVTTIYASKLGDAFLYDESKVVKMVAKDPNA